MPRNKSARISRIGEPAKIQDNTGFLDRLSTTIIGEFIAPITDRLTVLENELTGAAVQVGDVHVDTVFLAPGLHGGTSYVEPEGGFDETTINRPVIVQQAASADDSDEGGIVLFTGTVLNVKRMRVRWFAPFGAPRSVRVVYLIG